MTQKQQNDPDRTQQNNGAYWAAALALAVRIKDTPRIAKARRNLQRLGYPIDIIGYDGDAQEVFNAN